jgi:hypothetical protein
VEVEWLFLCVNGKTTGVLFSPAHPAKIAKQQAGFNVRYSGCLLFIYVNTSNKFCNDNLDNPLFSRGWKLVVVMMKLTALPAFQLY